MTETDPHRAALPMTLAAFRAELLELYGPPLSSPAAAGKIRQVLDLLAAQGVAGPAELRALTIAEFTRAVAATRGPRTVNGLLDYLRLVFRYALDEGHIPRSPFDGRKFAVRATAPPRDRHLPRAAVARLLAHLATGRGSWEGGRLDALTALVAYTGVRKMEALCLRVEDVHLAEGYLEVVPRRRLKTVESAAPVPLPDRLVAVLGPWLARCGSPWAFPGVKRRGPWTGGPLGERPVERLRAAGLACDPPVPGCNFLALRHTWATQAEAWGLPELLIQRVLRHTTPITQRSYRHPDLANLRAAVRGIGFSESAEC